ncbi:MAG: N-acetylmuramoyl-L-alanine amidase [Phycisphaerales bacterium]|nr:N-acetylmuramoyl-L-alanine amidase [Phycisphaerales bacterium]
MRRAFRAMAVLMGASVAAVGAMHAAGGVSGRAGSVLAAPAWKVAAASAESPVAGRVEAAAVAAPASPRITPRDAAIDRDRWRAIVIHDSGTPAGDVAAIERRHQQAGLAGLGFHFVVGNGQGMDDGAIAVGPRWERQLSGAHAPRGWRTPVHAGGAVALDAAGLNQSAIAICLVGRADRRPFTDRQCREVRALVRQLQAEFGIPDRAVFTASELQGRGLEPASAWAALRASMAP